MACRNLTACRQVADDIRARWPNSKVECRELDLSRLDSVHSFCQAVGSRPITTLIHNAGVMAVDDHRTEDSFETTFQVNHLAPFLLTRLLVPALRLSDQQSTDSWDAERRVVWVSSGLHIFGHIPLSTGIHRADRCGGIRDIAYRQRGLLGRWKAYSDTKLLNAMMAAETHERLKEHGITSVSVRPGTVRTDITRTSLIARGMVKAADLFGITSSLASLSIDPVPVGALTLPWPPGTAQEAAAGIVHAATAPKLEGGSYYDHGRLSPCQNSVRNSALTAQVWEDSVALLQEWHVLNREELPTSSPTSLQWRSDTDRSFQDRVFPKISGSEGLSVQGDCEQAASPIAEFKNGVRVSSTSYTDLIGSLDHIQSFPDTDDRQQYRSLFQLWQRNIFGILWG
eukprot:CAMPEP_0184304854 /NCGR_PEP_ID=MMETSP1049-20130417/14280_1 /TAXON_ID=77928 /ORGANISM="Proteomonas sulcata, Strain CCMP704" /LENGTH=397 /DNA_ID=CAMNT_0026616777 /DNA_START=53 /DNA_END=1245 /DNA_ORIENTATION=+